MLDNALSGTTYVSSETEENGRMVLLKARRQDGTLVNVRFRAVSSSDATDEPAAGDTLRPGSVRAGGGGCLMLLGGWIPALRGVPRGYSRVRIEAGEARLDIVCQDVEWWEDGPGAPQSGGSST